MKNLADDVLQPGKRDYKYRSRYGDGKLDKIRTQPMRTLWGLMRELGKPTYSLTKKCHLQLTDCRFSRLRIHCLTVCFQAILIESSTW